MWWGFSPAGSGFSLGHKSESRTARLPFLKIVSVFTFQPWFLCNNSLLKGPLHTCYD